ncbi:MAG: hypothetical protein KY455_01155 [Euryarchaeota archaeon]|nr:hypothetical protein [Euryarchaeota archaeon]
MIGGGGGLIALGSLALLARYLEMGKVHALALGQPATLYHTFTVGTALIGLILVIFAPTARRRMTRVTLDPAPDPYRTRPDIHRLAGNGKNGNGGKKGVGTNGDSAKTAPKARPSTASIPIRASATTSARPAQAVAASATTVPPVARPTNGDVAHHANDAATDRDHSDMPPRDALLSEIDELDRKANEIKVRYGLGKMSPGGYRKFIEELDTRRSQLENLLMEHER